MHSSGLLFISNLFSSDMIIIVFVALLLFGGEKLPEIARGLGKGIRDFKDASEGIKREINDQINNYEVKKEEDKKIEEAIAANQAAAQNKQIAATAETKTHDGFTPVANTIPVSDSVFNTHTAAVSETAVHHEPVTEHHAGITHEEAGTPTNEPIKNS